MYSQVSIIIPTLNESDCLQQTLNNLALLDPPPLEILIVDGGSQDNTVEIAKQSNISVLVSERSGRSQQMNLGAAKAQGDYLCFVHADTLVPNDLNLLIKQTLRDRTIACGGFISIMSGQYKTQWITSLHNYLKTYYAAIVFRPHLFLKGLRILFGDQVMFCRRDDFLDCGGFDPQLPIMEDADLCIRLVQYQYGRIYLVDRLVQSSDRRVAKWGWLKANAIYLYIGCLWGIGVSPSYLKRFYKDIR